MALLYLDTSVIVAAFVREAATDRVQHFLEQQGAPNLAVSGWVVTEFSSALALKMRRREIEADLFASVHARLQPFVAGVVMLGVHETDFTQAAVFCRRHELGLRAADALHLAVAAGAGCRLATLDERLAQAAPEFGVPVVIPTR